jgi:chromosome segregation ATPase
MNTYEEEIRINKLNELNQTRSSLVQDIMLIDAQIEVLTSVVDEINTKREERRKERKERKELEDAQNAEPKKNKKP